MKILLRLLIACSISNVVSVGLKAQTFVTIPDPQFVGWLQVHFPSAMNGNQLDINNPLVTATHTVNLYYQNISNLSGIEHFTSLTHLNCETNHLTSLPTLPNTLKHLFCSVNDLTSLPTLPTGLITLSCPYNDLTSLTSLPISLKYLIVHNNKLASLPGLSDSLKLLWCYNNQLTTLPTLSSQLVSLNCGFNFITSLPELPPFLANLSCAYNKLITLPELPGSIDTIYCNNNMIKCFSNFPDSLTYINYDNNPFNCFPNYVNALRTDTLIYPLCSPGNNNGCVVNPSVIFVPNIFSPNHDNVNDSFVVRAEYVADFELRIYSRWGEELFQSQNVFEGWKGHDRQGQDCSEGTYYYTITYTNHKGHSEHTFGFLQLVR